MAEVEPAVSRWRKARAALSAAVVRPPHALRRIALGCVLLAAVVFVLDRLFPLPVRGAGEDFTSIVVARDGTPLRAFPDARHVWRYPVKLEEVSPLYVDTLIRYEDRAFWWHPGVNPFALARATWQRVRYGRVISGGSTLTMQVARIIDPVPHTEMGKLHQILRALQLEMHYSKREILSIYLNYAPMGGTLEGVEAASRAYLSKPAKRLSAAEAALLTVLPQSPSRLRPDRYDAVAKSARDKVIRRMAGTWPQTVIDEALADPIVPFKIKEPLMAPLLAERLHQEMPGVARIDSTIDADAQRVVESLLADRAHILPPRVSAAALVIDNRDMTVLAYAGSADFSDRDRFPWVDMVKATRSPGSTLKPFLYGFALDDGLISAESLLSDTPQSFQGYAPGNFGQAYSGPVSTSEALLRSLNVPAVQVLDQFGAQRFVGQLRQGGLKLQFPKGTEPNLSVILGGAGTTLEGLVGSYSALARDGVAGRVRFTRNAPREDRTMMSAGAAYIVRDILEGGGQTAKAVGQRPDRKGVAYKTGTSYGFRDAWAVGVSDRYTVGVWIGRPDGTPNPGFYGANIAAPMLLNIFDALPGANTRVAHARPATVTQATICWPSGTLAELNDADACQQKRLTWLLNGAAPPTLLSNKDKGEPIRTWYVDTASGKRAMPDCSRQALKQVRAPRWPVLLEPWLPEDVKQKSEPPAWSPQCQTMYADEGAVHIQGAVSGEWLARAPNNAAPTVQLSVRGARTDVSWLVNGALVASGKPNKAQNLVFDKGGRYDITAIDQEGHFDHIAVNVRR
jgi:penicillin-binding protein 1C